jgi:hypothetical protein
MPRRLALAWVLLAAALAALAPAAAQAQGGDNLKGPGTHPELVRTAPYDIETVPPMPGVRLTVGGKDYFTDRKGKISLRLPGVRTDEVRGVVKVHDKKIRPGVVARFSRWYGHSTLTFDYHYKIDFAFRDLHDEPVDPNLVSKLTVKSRTGVRTYLEKGESVWLQGSRVVPFTGDLVSKDIDYQIERALVDGTNVVNRAQQRFTPSETQDLDVQLLFYSLTIDTKDALLGFPIGSAVEMTYPSGRVVRHPLKDGKATLASLPRGTYDVKVVAPGVSFTRPVSVSRNQEVELKVISYLDMALAFFALAGLAIGLLLARRPHLVRALGRRLRLRRREPVGAGRD